VAKEQAQFAGKENVARKVVDITFDPASMLILLVHEPDLSALLVAEVARGFPPNQSCAIAFTNVIDVNLYWCTRRDTKGIRERGHIRHRGFDQQPSARSKIIVTSFPYRELVFQAEHMRNRRSRNQNQIEVRAGGPSSHVASNVRWTPKFRQLAKFRGPPQ
jgi:hypothetical protein